MVLVGSSQVREIFSLMCFEFLLEISNEERQTCHFCRNHR